MPDEPPITQQAQGSYIAQATHGGTATVQVVLPPAPVQEQNRVRMLSRLRYRYDEEWEQSLEGAGLLTLGLVSKPDAVLPHIGLLFLSPQQPERPLPPGTSIAQVYEQAGQELLILGEPGAGKSTLLLDLARRLVERAEQDTAQPFPVILPLSTWAVKRRPLTDWLSEQLTQLYNVPRRLSRSWVQTDQLLLLLDGFDEVPQEARVACIQAIAAYREEHLVPIVICSRRTEFEAIPRPQRLVMQSAVVVQPLTQEQVGTYLLEGGEAFSALRTVLHSNPVLAELVTTPLMVHVLTLTYTGAKARDLPQGGSPEEQQRRIFASYIERMIERRRNRISFPLQRIIPWLSWLARQMQQQSQTIFYLETLQPDWLQKGQKQVYYQATVTIMGALLGMIVSWIVVAFFNNSFSSNSFNLKAFDRPAIIAAALGFVFGQSNLLPRLTGVVSRWRQSYKRALTSGVFAGLATALVWGLEDNHTLGLFDWFNWSLQGRLIAGFTTACCCGVSALIIQGIVQVRGRNRLRGRLLLLKSLQKTYWYAVSIGMLMSLVFIIRSDWAYWWYYGHAQSGTIFGLGYALTEGMNDGIIGMLLGLIFLQYDGTIYPAETIAWSMNGLRQSLFAGNHLRNTLLISLLTFVVRGSGSAILSGQILTGMSDGIGVGLSFGISYWFLLGLWNGVAQKTLDDHRRIRPNQGIRQSARNGLFIGGITVAIFLLLSNLSPIISNEIRNEVFLWQGYALPFEAMTSVYSWSIGLSTAFAGGLLICLLSGGLAGLQHYTLRFLLWRTGSVPWHYVRFLDEAAGCILLRKGGGGYMFMHRLILDYFASLENPLIKPEPPQPSQAVPPRVCSACGYQEKRPGARFCVGCGTSLVS